MGRKIILASNSPRRKELFERLKLQFESVGSNFEEDMTLTISPEELAEKLAYGKAKAVADKYNDAVVIGADTFIKFEEKILGKPKNDTEAKEILRNLSGKQHSVFTGFSIIDTKTGKCIAKACEAKVIFRKLDENDIEGYVASGEVMDKAGAYAIQGLGAVLVEKIEGDYYTIMGLPICQLAKTLKEDFGVDFWQSTLNKC